MNATPHTHEVKIVPKHSGRNGDPDLGPWYVEYGDTKVKFAHFWEDPHEWPIEKQRRVIGVAVEKAVKKHDQGSIKAGEEEARRRAVYNARMARKEAVRTLQDGFNDKLAPKIVYREEDMREYYQAYGYTLYVRRPSRQTLDRWGETVLQEQPALPAGK